MNTLVNTFAHGTIEIWHMAVLMAAAARNARSSDGKRRSIELDHHTRRDIGFEPGSITWI